MTRSKLLSVLVVIGGVFVAPNVMLVVFGPQYVEGGAVLQILLLSIPFFTARLVVFFALVALAGEQSLVRVIVYALLANVVLNLVLISALGTVGAAWATVTTEAFFCALLARYGRAAGLRFPPVTRFWQPSVACVVMSLALVVTGEQHPVVRVVLGGGVYALGLLVLGTLVFRKGVPSLNL